MPCQKGSSREAISSNIASMVRSGKAPQDQAVAIALKEAGKSRGSGKRKRRRESAVRLSETEFVDAATRLMALPGDAGERFRRASTAINWRLQAGGERARRWMELPHFERLSLLAETALSLPIRMGATNPWVIYRGPRGGKGWKHSITGDIRYGGDRPGASETGGDTKEETPSRLHPVVEKHAEGKRAEMTQTQFRAGLNDLLDDPAKYGVSEDDSDRLEQVVVAVDRYLSAKKTPKDITAWWGGLKPAEKLDAIDDVWMGGHTEKDAIRQAFNAHYAEATGKGEEPEAVAPSEAKEPEKPALSEPSKKPWQMTPDEFIASKASQVGMEPSDVDPEYQTEYRRQHWHAIHQAAVNGERITPRVLDSLTDEQAEFLRGRTEAVPPNYKRPSERKGEQLPGGKADARPDSDFDADALFKGTSVESEHTDDPAQAKEIAKDHLAEDPKYYDKLAKMEGKGEPEPAAGPTRVEVRGDIYSKTETGWRNESNPAYNASDEMMQRWRERGIVKEPLAAKETESGVLAGTGGESETGRLPAGQPVGSPATGVSPTVSTGTGGGTGGGRGGHDAGLRPVGGVGRDESAEPADGRGDAEIDSGRAGIAAALPGTELDQPQTADVQAALSKPPTPETPTDLSAGNWRYHTRDFCTGGLKTKFRNNIAALQTLRVMKIEGRDRPTPEEQAAISKFVGWGQFPGLFARDQQTRIPWKERQEMDEQQLEIDPDFKPREWEKEAKELKALLTPEEWDSARASTKNAHFTHPDIVDAHWAMARKLGYTGGKFLETSAGVGYYLGMMPQDLAARTHSAAVELESSTGAMLQALYPATHTEVQGFQEYQSPQNFYDLIASNVPFGDYGVHDPKYNKYNAKIHDYFFLKSADLAKPGGLVMHITSTGTMDKPDNNGIRAKLAETCDLVAAYRMPGDTHMENAGTAVVTDMIILRKRLPGEKPVDETETPPEAEPKQPGFTGITTDSLGRLYHWKDGKRVPGPNWMDVTDIPDPDGGEALHVNKYWDEHPENVLGRLDRSGTMRASGQKNVSITSPEELSDELGRKVIVEVDEDSKKRRFVFEDDGSKVPNADIRRIGEAAFKKRLQDAIDRLPEGVFKPMQNSKAAFEPEIMPAPGEVKDGGFVVKNGKLFQRTGGALVEVETDSKTIARISGMLAIRDAGRAVNAKEAANEDATDDRAELNRLYDEYVEKFGFLHERANEMPMRNDPDTHFIQALEKWNAKTNTATKSDTFSKRTVGSAEEVTSVDNVSDGLSASLHKFGSLDIDYIADKMGVSVADVEFQMVDQGIGYRDPAEGWKPADIYLSGNVRRKLIEATAAAAVDPKYKANVEALLKVQPEDVDYSLITPKMGAPWIPASDISDFATELLEANGHPIMVKYVPETGEWLVKWSKDGERLYKKGPLANQVWGTPDANTLDCIRAALTNKSITIKGGWDEYTDGNGVVQKFQAVKYNDEGKEIPITNRKATDDANAKVQEIKEKFKEWIWSDDARTMRLARLYNDTLNNIRDIKYNGQHQKFPGMNPDILPELFPHIKDFVWQVVTTGNGLAGHEVGTGKTFAMIASAMELRRLGLAKKPCIACLKSNLGQITADCLKLYPNAKILSTALPNGKVVTDAKGRSDIIARMATGDYDIVLMTHDQLDQLKMHPDVQRKYINEELAELTAAIEAAERDDPDGKSMTVKRLEAAKSALEKKLLGLVKAEDKDLAMTFEETGIDQLFVDEAHQYKSLNVITRADRIKGIPTRPSQRATNMLMRTRWLQENHGGRGVVFATGTPINNSMAELFNMQRYLQGNALKERGVHHFDAWVSTFGEIETRQEVSVTGEFKPATRLSKFTNIPEIMHIARQTLDTVRADDLKRVNPETGEEEKIIKRPTRKDSFLRSPHGPAMTNLMASLVKRANALKGRGRAQKGDDNMLVICTDGRKGAVDMRLLDENAPDDPNSKTNQSVRKMLELHKANPDGVQILFSDVGVHPMGKAKKAKEAAHADREIVITAAEDEADTDLESQLDADTLNMLTNGESFSEADLGANGNFRLYQDIIDKLVAGGIPRDQIADFSQLEGKKKEQAMADMRDGKIKVALGSTQRLGTGCNVQNKLMAMHHLDVPWTPAALEQRDGRGWRHGNENKEIGIYRYVAEGSLDQMFWDLVATKAYYQNQILNNRNSNIRTMQDDDSEVLTPEQLSAVASGDPRRLQRVNLMEEVNQLQAAASRHVREQERIKKSIAKVTNELPAMEEKAQKYDTDIKHLESQPKFEFTIPDTPAVEADEWEEIKGSPAVPGTAFTKRDEANEAFQKLFNEAPAYDPDRYWESYEPVHLGTYRGMKIILDPRREAFNKHGSVLTIEGPSGERYAVNPSMGSIEYVVNNFVNKRSELQKFIDSNKRQIESSKGKLGKSFPKAKQLEEKRAELDKLNEDVGLKKREEKKPKGVTMSLDRTRLSALCMSLASSDLSYVAGYDDAPFGDDGFSTITARLLELPGHAGRAIRMAAEAIDWRLQAGGKPARRWQRLPLVRRLSLLVDTARRMPVRPIRMAADSNPWIPYRGSRGGRGWQHSGTKDVRYVKERPGANETGGSGEETPSPFHPSADRHMASAPRESMTQDQFKFVLNQLLEAPEDNGLSEDDSDRLNDAVVAIDRHVKRTPAVEKWWHGLKPHEKLDVIGDLMAEGHQGQAAFKAAFVKHHGEVTKPAETAQDEPAPAKELTSIERTTLENQLQMYQDNIATKKAKREPIPQKWLDGMAAIKAKLAGKEHVAGSTAAMEVFGHPLATSNPKFANLIPITITPDTDLSWRFTEAQKHVDELQTKIGKAHAIANGKVRATPKDKKAAKAYLSSQQGTEDETVRDMLRNETLPELQRLAKIQEQAKPAAKPAAEPPKPTAGEAAVSGEDTPKRKATFRWLAREVAAAAGSDWGDSPKHWIEKAKAIAAADKTPEGVHKALVNFDWMRDLDKHPMSKRDKETADAILKALEGREFSDEVPKETTKPAPAQQPAAPPKPAPANRVTVRGEPYVKTANGWQMESNPAYKASDETMERWRGKGIVKEAAEKPAPQPAAPSKPATDLFGAPVKPDAPKAEPIESLGGKQQNLFGKKGLPGQQNLFADAGVPESMVQKPQAPAEPPKGDTPWTGGEIAKGMVYRAPLSALHVDPDRFQFKLNVNKQGVTDELKEVEAFDVDFSGVVAVWRDPANGKTYVVNGHHRYELAGRLNVEGLDIRYIDKPDAKSARAKGALINIVEGRGTAVDGAKFLRDTGMTVADMKKGGVSLKGAVAKNATILVDLNEAAFNNVVRGTLSVDTAIAVASHLKDHDDQNELFRIVSKRGNVAPKVLESMAREMANTPKMKAGDKAGGGGLLFGGDEDESLFITRNELKTNIRSDMVKEVNDFLVLASKRRAGATAEAGNVLNVDENKRIADDAKKILSVYDTLVDRRGSISDAINQMAQEYAKAKSKVEQKHVRKQTIAKVRAAVFAEAGFGPTEPGREAGASRLALGMAKNNAARSRAQNSRSRNPKPSGLIRSLAAVDPDFVAGYD